MHFLISTTIACTSMLCGQTWSTVGGNAQHSGISTIGAQSYVTATKVTEVDQNLAGTSGDILAHYGAPIITAKNTVFVPVRTTGRDLNGNHSFAVEVHDGTTSNLALKWTFTTDYAQPSSAWVPSYGPALNARNVFYFPGAGGTVYYVNNPDTNSGVSGQLAFYGLSTYMANTAAFNSTVMISTPIVSDRYGDIFFGFTVTGSNPANLLSGVARITAAGVGSWVSAQAASGDSSMTQVPFNSVPALSNDHSTLYFAVSNGSAGYLVAVNATTLAPFSPAHQVRLKDPSNGNDALINNISSASPVVGLDGDVFYGVLENPCCAEHNDRGWLLHFDSTLTTTKTPGSFGWDDTPSIVPYSLVPSYQGTSTYLVFTKYNNYKDTGTGNGLNKIAVLDPNDLTELDPVNGTTTVMGEVITILGVTPDTPPAGAVREWCINSAAIDKINKVAIVNSEDGNLYRWDFTTNTFTQSIGLNGPVGEAYTPTVIGPDGTAYAINDGFLYAVRNH